MRNLIVMTALLALVAVACGGGSNSDGVASLETSDTEALAAGGDGATDDPAANTEVDAEEAMLAFTQCLRDEGLDIDDPEVDSEGNLRLGLRGSIGDEDFDIEAFRAAREACADILEGVAFQFRDVDRTAIEDTLVEFATCMRDNGYDMPDPDFSNLGPGERGGGGPFGAIDPEDAGFIEANEACQEILVGAFGDGGPRRGPGGGGSGGNG